MQAEDQLARATARTLESSSPRIVDDPDLGRMANLPKDAEVRRWLNGVEDDRHRLELGNQPLDVPTIIRSSQGLRRQEIAQGVVR